MRESYGTLFDRFWDGPTGREIQARGKDAVILAAYLSSNRYANMIGLYELPMLTIAHHLVVMGSTLGIRGRAIRNALTALWEVHFAYYDEASSFVWVKEMARIRLQLEPTEHLARTDNRVPNINKIYIGLKPNPFLPLFHVRYATDLHLSVKRQGASQAPPKLGDKPLPNPLDTPSEASQQEQVQVQQQQQVQGSGSREQEQGSGTERAAAPPQRVPESDPDPNNTYAVVTALVTKDILPRRLPDHELMAATQTRCDELKIPCNEETARKAIDSALFRYYRTLRHEFDLPPDPRGIYHDTPA